MILGWRVSRAWPSRAGRDAYAHWPDLREGNEMTSIADIEIEPLEVRPRPDAAAAPSGRSRAAPLIAMALILLPVNAGILLYTAKNAAELRESREDLATLKQSIDALKQQIDRQGRNIAKDARSEDISVIRRQTEDLRKEVGALSERMRSGLFSSSGSVTMSAPGKGPTQHFEPTDGSRAQAEQMSDESVAAIDSEGVSLAKLPRYERSVSPEGKLILRKVQ